MNTQVLVSELYCISARVFPLKRMLEATKKCIFIRFLGVTFCNPAADGKLFVKIKPENILKPCFGFFGDGMNEY